MVTSSEDQKCNVFKFDKDEILVPIQTLEGHSLAVTSIDWKGETFVSCSDDRTIRVYSQQTRYAENHFELSFILDTTFIVSGHALDTLTYLHLELIPKPYQYHSSPKKKGTPIKTPTKRSTEDTRPLTPYSDIDNQFLRLCVVAEHGYLFVWDFNSDHKYDSGSRCELKYSRKVSVGSIEALSIRNVAGRMRGVSCQSDCSFNLMTFDTANVNPFEERRESNRYSKL